jgi:hypothetical protein
MTIRHEILLKRPQTLKLQGLLPLSIMRPSRLRAALSFLKIDSCKKQFHLSTDPEAQSWGYPLWGLKIVTGLQKEERHPKVAPILCTWSLRHAR